jgi:hypothetical protein
VGPGWQSLALSALLIGAIQCAGQAQTKEGPRSSGTPDTAVLPEIAPPNPVQTAPAANDPCRHLSSQERAQFPALCPPGVGAGELPDEAGVGHREK